MTNSSQTTLAVVVVAALAAAGAGAVYYQKHHRLNVAAGVPLASTSAAPVAGETGTELTTSAEKLPTTTSITLPEDHATQPATPAPTSHPTAFDPTAARLGTTLSLLVNAWPAGGVLPRQLANAAADLAAQSGQPALANAAEALRASTPREGPLTLQLLLLEASSVVELTPPENLPENDTQATAEKSWFRKQLEKLVTISETPSTQNRWVTAIHTVQQQLVRGAVTDAQATLQSPPLDGDARLDNLRALTRGYLAQTGKLQNLVTAYTNTYLLAKDASE